MNILSHLARDNLQMNNADGIFTTEKPENALRPDVEAQHVDRHSLKRVLAHV